MAFDFHTDAPVYIEQQYQNSKNFVLPFIAKHKKIEAGSRVLEIGCGQGGVLKPFLEIGCHVVGVDLDEQKLNIAKNLFANDISAGNASFIFKNIYDVTIEADFKELFDVIILKDSIEHIPDQKKIIDYLKNFLAKDGIIFFGFPPWHMPFGGHQQICKNKLLSLLPYYHLLPKAAYTSFLKLAGEPEPVIKELLEIKETGISIERFERIVKETGYQIVERKLYLINPIYRYKFKLEPKEQLGFISGIPFFRNFVSTCAYYLIKV